MVESAGFRVVRGAGAIPVPGVTARGLCKLAHRVGILRSSLFAYNFVVTAEPA
jgi:hypothetical protein